MFSLPGRSTPRWLIPAPCLVRASSIQFPMPGGRANPDRSLPYSSHDNSFPFRVTCMELVSHSRLYLSCSNNWHRGYHCYLLFVCQIVETKAPSLAVFMHFCFHDARRTEGAEGVYCCLTEPDLPRNFRVFILQHADPADGQRCLGMRSFPKLVTGKDVQNISRFQSGFQFSRPSPPPREPRPLVS